MEKLPVIILLVLGVLLCAYGWFSMRLARAAQAFDRQIALGGVDAEAEVTDHQIIHGRRTRSYYITFEYTVNSPGGQPEKIAQKTSITGADYQRLNPGDKVAIRYLPNAPTWVMLRGAVEEQTVPAFLTAGIGGIVAGSLLIIIAILAWPRLR